MRSPRNAVTVVACRCASTPVLVYCQIRARVPSMSSPDRAGEAGPMRADARPTSTPAKKRVGPWRASRGSGADRPLAIRAIARVDEQRHGTVVKTFDDGRDGSRVGAGAVRPGNTPRRTATRSASGVRCVPTWIWMCVKVVWSAASGSWNAVAPTNGACVRWTHPTVRISSRAFGGEDQIGEDRRRLARRLASRPARSTCAALRPFDSRPSARRAATPARSQEQRPCVQWVSVSIGGATLVDGLATSPPPAADASMTRVHVGGRARRLRTRRRSPRRSRPAGMSAVPTSTRSQSETVGNRNGAPPFGIVMFTSPTKNCVCVQEFRNAPSRAARPVFSPPP